MNAAEQKFRDAARAWAEKHEPGTGIEVLTVPEAVQAASITPAAIPEELKEAVRGFMADQLKDALMHFEDRVNRSMKALADAKADAIEAIEDALTPEEAPKSE